MSVQTVRFGSVRVRIYCSKNRGRKIWEVRDHGDGRGKTYRKAFSTLIAARSYAERIHADIANGLSLTRRRGPRQLSAADRWLDLCERHGKNPDEVALSLEKLWRDEARQALPDVPTVTATVEQFIAAKTRQAVGAYHLRDLNLRLGKFARDFQVQINRIRRPEIEQWLDALKVAPRTWNNYRADLVSLFAFARQCKYLPADWTELEALKKAELADRDPDVFTPAEFRRVLEAATPDKFQVLLAISAFAGIRSEEVFKLTWADFDWTPGEHQAGTIYLRRKIVKGKASQKRPRQVPIPENLAAWLEPYRANSGQVCPYKNPKVVAGMKTKLARRLGIRWKKNALRKSWISYRLALSQDPYKVAGWAGNSVSVIKSNYERLVSAEMAEEWFAIRPQTVMQGILRLDFGPGNKGK